jgi:hypothetical protein
MEVRERKLYINVLCTIPLLKIISFNHEENQSEIVIVTNSIRLITGI